MLDYISVADAAVSRIQKLCEEKRIEGVIRFGRSWAIPKTAQKPADGRKKEATLK